jgi:hypothetical protein
MSKNVVTRIKVSVLVVFTSEHVLGVLNKIERAEGIPQRILDRQTCGRNGVVCIVVPGEGVPMSERKERHLEANEGILNGSSKVVGAVTRNIVRYSSEPNKYRQEESLPVRGEDDALDAQKFGHGPEWLQVLCHAHPEHG